MSTVKDDNLYICPRRPSLPIKPSGQMVKLASNSYSLRIKTSNYIFVYAVKFPLEIPENNTPLRRTIMRGLHSDLEKAFRRYIFTGPVLYSPTDLGVTPLTLTYSSGTVKYAIECSRAHMICLQDIVSAHKDPAKAQTALTFLNMIVKNLLTACHMFPVGRTKRYLLPEEAKIIPDYAIEVWPGYYTSVNLCEAGLLLEVDYSARILRQESVYDFMRGVQKRVPRSWQEAVKDELVGKSVLARYGNKRTYVVSGIEFTLSPAKCEFPLTTNDANTTTSTATGDTSIISCTTTTTIYNYYKTKYLIDIRDKNQPLLLSVRKQRDGKESRIYLVPELCSLTGLPPALREDRYALRQFSAYTKLSPGDRAKEALKLLSQFSKAKARDPRRPVAKDEPMSAETVMNNWNLQVDLVPNEITGRVLSNQVIGLRGSKALTVRENGQFNLREEIMTPLALDKWILVYDGSDKTATEMFVQTIGKAASTFGIAVGCPKYVVAHGGNSLDYISALKEALKTHQNPQIVVFLLGWHSSGEYSELKKFANLQNPPLLTQMLKVQSLRNPKSLMTICSKIALQINAKRNGVLWKVSVPSDVPRKTMVVGVDISKEGKPECLGFSSSYDPQFTRYYTQVMSTGESVSITAGIGNLLVKALERFYIETRKTFLPELIIVYRDGFSETQANGLIVAEVQGILMTIRKKFTNYEPKLLFATVHKKIHTRFFIKNQHGLDRRGSIDTPTLSNPQPGTVVDSGITDPRKYEFLIMPQHVNEGTGTPSRITVVYDSSGLKIDTFEELTNALCYCYYNWQGAIRTPAPCKYAAAHARLISKYVHADPNEKLLSNVYFL